MSTQQHDHHLEVERQIIHLMLKHRDSIDEMLSDGFSEEFFDPHHQLIVQSIYKEFVGSEQKRLLTRNGYRQLLQEMNIGGDLVQNLTVYDKCFLKVVQPDDLGHLKKQLLESYIARKSHFFIQEFRSNVKSEGWLAASHKLSEQLSGVLGTTEVRKSTLLSLSEIKDEFLKDLQYRAEHPEEVVRCGIPEIDDVVNVGFKPQMLTLFVADVGGGKSSVMLNVALETFERGFSVLFVPLEMGRLDVTSRIISNKANVNYNKIARPEMLTDEEWKRIREAAIWLDRSSSRFCILDTSDRISVSQLSRELEKRALAFKPQMVVIDYVANIKPDRRFNDRNDLEIGEILKSLRFLGKKYGFHTVTAAQMGRSAIRALRENPDAAPDSTSIRGSHEYSADSDTIIGLLRNRDEPEKLKVIAIKSRYAEAFAARELRFDAPFCRIMSTQDNRALVATSSELESNLNENPWDISEALKPEEEPRLPKIEFSGSMSLDDDLDEVANLG